MCANSHSLRHFHSYTKMHMSIIRREHFPFCEVCCIVLLKKEKEKKKRKKRAIPVRKMPPPFSAFLVIAFCCLVFTAQIIMTIIIRA